VLQELLGADVAEAKRKGKVRKALQGAGKGMMTLRQTGGAERHCVAALLA